MRSITTTTAATMGEAKRRREAANTPEHWRAELQRAVQLAQAGELRDGDNPPTFLLCLRDGSRRGFRLRWDSDRTKLASYQIARMLCIAHNPMALIHTSTAWASVLTPAIESGEQRVRDAADRREIIFACVIWRDKAGSRRELCDTREIERDADGRLRGFGPGEPTESAGGVLVEIFPATAPTAAEQQEARELLARDLVDPAQGRLDLSTPSTGTAAKQAGYRIYTKCPSDPALTPMGTTIYRTLEAAQRRFGPEVEWQCNDIGQWNAEYENDHWVIIESVNAAGTPLSVAQNLHSALPRCP